MHLQLDIFVHCGFLDDCRGVGEEILQGERLLGKGSFSLLKLGIKTTGWSCSKEKKKLLFPAVAKEAKYLSLHNIFLKAIYKGGELVSSRI